MGEAVPACEHARAAVGLYRQCGDRHGEGRARTTLSLGSARLGRLDEATGEAWALNGLGEASCTAADHAGAVTRPTEGLVTATELRARDQQARAPAGLARAYAALGDAASARRHEEHARAIHADLGLPGPMSSGRRRGLYFW
jgi:hypothetical protein